MHFVEHTHKCKHCGRLTHYRCWNHVLNAMVEYLKLRDENTGKCPTCLPEMDCKPFASQAGLPPAKRKEANHVKMD